MVRSSSSEIMIHSFADRVVLNISPGIRDPGSPDPVASYLMFNDVNLAMSSPAGFLSSHSNQGGRCALIPGSADAAMRRDSTVWSGLDASTNENYFIGSNIVM
jgi:hypothetical protein